MNANQQLSYTVDGAVKATNLTRSRIYVAIGTGELRSFKTGKRRMISAKALQDWVAKLERDSAGRRA